MIHPKFVDLVIHLDDKDVALLKQYVQSRMAGQSSLMKTFMYVINKKSDVSLINSASVINKAIFTHVKDKVVSNHLSTLFQLAEEWMIQEQLKSEKFTAENLLLKWQKKKGLSYLSEQTARTLEKNLIAQKEYDLEKMQVYLNLLNYHLIQNDNKVKDHPQDSIKQLLKGYHESVKAQYLIFKTELENLMSIHHGDFSSDVDMIEQISALIPETELTQIIAQLHRLVIHDDMGALYHLKDVLIAHHIDDKSQLHYILTSYCYQRVMRLWSKGKHNDLALANELFNYAISYNIFTKNGKIPSAAFHTFVTQSAFYSKDYEQTEHFIQTWINKVDTTKKEATIALARAQNCLYTERYEEIFQYTWRSDFDTFNQKNLAQGIHLIATFMFRKKEKEVFENTLSLSLLFLKRNKLKMSNHIYESYKNLCDFMNLVHKNKQVALDTFKPIIYRSWCEKILKDRL